jgi:nitroreductase
MTLSVHETNRLKHAPAVEGVLPVFHQRWSPRSFADRAVRSSDLAKIFEAARWTPSSSNIQPWRFIVGLRGTDTNCKIVSALMGFNQSWAGAAPVLILGVAHTASPRGKNAYALFDLGAATYAMTLQAASLGLSTHQMAGFDHAIARKALEIPEDYEIGSVIALGYQGEPSALADEELIKRELAPRERKPLKELVFSAWDTPADFV